MQKIFLSSMEKLSKEFHILSKSFHVCILAQPETQGCFPYLFAFMKSDQSFSRKIVSEEIFAQIVHEQKSFLKSCFPQFFIIVCFAITDSCCCKLSCFHSIIDAFICEGKDLACRISDKEYIPPVVESALPERNTVDPLGTVLCYPRSFFKCLKTLNQQFRV